MFQPLSIPLQDGVRFFSHPLPSRGFCLCYLRLTKSNRPLLDSVGLTLLYRLVFYPPFRCYLFCDGGYVHTIYRTRNYKSYPFTFWSKPISLIWLLFV